MLGNVLSDVELIPGPGLEKLSNNTHIMTILSPFIRHNLLLFSNISKVNDQ